MPVRCPIAERVLDRTGEKKNSPTRAATRTPLVVVTSSLSMASSNPGNAARVSVAISHAAIPSKWAMRWAISGPAGGRFSR
jgi:hypothetical protein